MSAAAKVFQQIRAIVDEHDQGDNPPCGSMAWGVMMAFADIQRLGWDEGDVVYPSKGIKLHAGGQYGNIRVLCDGVHAHDLDHDDEEIPEAEIVKEEIVRTPELVPA